MYVSGASSKLGSIPLAWRNWTVTKTIVIASQANSDLAVNPIFTSENNIFCHLLIFIKSTFLNKNIQEYHQRVKHLTLEQARRFVGPDLGQNYLLRLSADYTSRVTMRFVGITFSKMLQYLKQSRSRSTDF